MDWIQLRISTTTEGIEPVCAVLMDAGITGMEIEDAKDFHCFLEANRMGLCGRRTDVGFWRRYLREILRYGQRLRR